MKHIIARMYNLARLSLRVHRWRVHPLRFMKRRLDAIPINAPIFLLGVQGGGLTLLARMLHRHPTVVYATGNSRDWVGPDELQNVMGPLLPSDLTGLHHKIPPHPHYSRRDWLYATDELLPLYRRTTAASTDIGRDFKRAIRLVIGMYADDVHRARFVDKSQSFTVRLSLVNELLRSTDPCFILVVRNPYAMCYRAAFVSTPISHLPLSAEDRLLLAAQHWGNSFRCALQDAQEVNRFMVLRFEDLLSNPESLLRSICSFVGIDYCPSMIPAPHHHIRLGSMGACQGDRKWYPLRSDVNTRYLDMLEPWMVEVLAPKIGDLAQKWGYGTEGTDD